MSYHHDVGLQVFTWIDRGTFTVRGGRLCFKCNWMVGGMETCHLDLGPYLDGTRLIAAKLE